MLPPSADTGTRTSLSCKGVHNKIAFVHALFCLATTKQQPDKTRPGHSPVSANGVFGPVPCVPLLAANASLVGPPEGVLSFLSDTAHHQNVL